MAIKTLRVFAEFTSTGFVPMPIAGGIDYGYTLASTFPSSTPSSFQTDDPDLDVTVTAMTDFYVWIRINGTAWNPSYTRNVRVYPDSPDINNVVMNMIIATGPAGTSAYSQIVQTSNRLYFNGATVDTTYDSKFAGKTYINELNFGTAPQLATVATSGAYADLTGKPALSTVATSGLYTDLSAKPSGTAPISYNSGTNSFQITQAGASTNGSLSSADWNTFNNKQGTITLTTSGTSGASTFVGNTLNIPNYAPNLSVYVPYTGATTNVNLGTHRLTAADLVINHTSGSGVAASITKGGSGEALTVVKTSGSGNAASITGGVTLLDELHLNTDLVDAYIASATNWNTAYTNRIVSASSPLSITSNAISITQANTTTNGFLSSTDWNTFNSKQSALTLGNVTEVSSNVLMFPDGGTGKTVGNLSIQVVQASASTNGFLSSTDWTTFNNKQATLTGGASTITTSDLTVSRALISNASGKVDVSTVTSTELGYLSGVTSAIQTQLNAKQGTITNPVTGTGTTNYIPKWTSSSAIGNSNIQDSGTLVSVGVSSTISGSLTITRGSANPALIAIGANNGYGIIQVSGSANYQINAGTDTGGMGFLVGGSERVKILNNGNVGIGTSSPSSAFTTTLSINSSTGSQGILFRLADVDKGYLYTSSNNLNIGSNSGALVFNSNDTERMRITAAGNVGIGTSSPSSLLHVYSSASSNVTQRLEHSSTFGAFHIINNASSTFYVGINNSSGSLFGGVGGAYGGVISMDSAYALGFATSGTERMRITSGGDVTINGGHLNLTGSGEINHTGRIILDAGAGNGFLFRCDNVAVTAINITAGGNVLLNTSTDNGEKLYVSGSIRATGNITANSDLLLKKNLTLVDNPIDKLNQLNGYLYQWKENDEYQYGVIAQEVEKILPHAVQTGKNGIKGVAYNQLIPLLIEGFKVQQKEINELKSKIG
jgi:hypothetical protein